jgi:hypothetical protein
MRSVYYTGKHQVEVVSGVEEYNDGAETSEPSKEKGNVGGVCVYT